MKTILLVLALGFLAVQAPDVQFKPDAMPCMGALRAKVMAAQERSTPPGEWCQRPQPEMSKKAHSCACHQHDCSDPDPSHVSAHTDSACLNFCTTANCRCAVHDCP